MIQIKGQVIGYPEQQNAATGSVSLGRLQHEEINIAWFCLIALILGGSAYYFRITKQQGKKAELARQYEQALDLIRQKKLEEASDILLPLFYYEHYRGSSSLWWYCEAEKAMQEKNYERAHAYAEAIEESGLPEEFREYILSRRQVIIDRAEKARNDGFKKDTIPDVPYVGMSESNISRTGLGAPSGTVRHDYEIKNGERYLCNLYDFYRNGELIFVARCMEGTVIRVWDDRSRPKNDSVPAYKPPASGKDDDPYNAADYWSKEDFYDDHYDDFFDYEEAEDYWRDHQ